ncbi:DNA-binding transcriptional regulator, AcrR family [Saccharopolyspora antimicrobica]|uniref:DNA-binding transcriptional regulator, AcrR family n=2 Tax=Saccharopolyspora antimicrobica TaxID=455193 RepID=A0A1I4W8K7_9PSEU|nr:TetR family transcriptional regulator [Saccharopolyspora antimicrobica]SFN09319.1 DNA-binding transcriptional regulator, AcrR family [Saccharopolyspora antimicrobica]
MHYAMNRANDVRRRRIAQMTSFARRLTAERGLSGFTVEEVCEHVGISRRSFFNYFTSKDDVVLGVPARRDDEDLTAWFTGRGRPDDPGISPTLLDDLAELSVRRWDSSGITAESMHDVRAAFEREPRLLTKGFERLLRDEQSDVELVERREGLPSGDLRAAAAVQLIQVLVRASAWEFLAPADTGTYAEILGRRLAAARELLAPPHDPERTS